MTNPIISFADGIGRDIEDYGFNQQFFRNAQYLTNNRVNPYGRMNMAETSQNFALIHPDLEPELSSETKCCNTPDRAIVHGRRLANESLIEVTRLNYDLRLRNHRLLPRVTTRIGLTETENMGR